MAVHKDKDHIHCHLVTNSVSYEDGRKLHNTKKDLERMKQLTNQMCRERGLTVAEKGKHFDGSQIEKGEVIAWSKDKYNLFRQQVKDSFVADCAMAILKALENCISKEKFIEKMKQFGWNVNWTEKRKHITFQNQEGKKVRDSNLSKTFHLDISKEGLENEFNGNRKKARDSANRDSRSDEELAGYYRQVEAACEGAGGVTGASDGRERRVTGEKSEDERVYPEISGKDTQAENGKTEAILRESRNARRNSEIKRRNSSFDNRTVRNAEAESIASNDKTADFCSGIGTFLVNAIERNPESQFYGVELVTEVKEVAEIRTELISDRVKIEQKSVLDIDDNLMFDKIFCDYPWGIRVKESIGNNEELEAIYNIIPEVQKATAGDWVFIINVMNHLDKHGKAVVSVSNGVTWNGGINTVIREKFVKKDLSRR